MSIANFPSNLSNAIQQGYLERAFKDSLTSKLGYRSIATRQMFETGIGETKTYTRGGKLASNTTPLNPATNTNLDNGLTPQYWSIEQFVLAINEYAFTMDLNIVTNPVGIADQAIQNSEKLGENAARSFDELARNFIFGNGDPNNRQAGAYMGGNTRVRVALGAPGTSVAVDDIRGFIYTIPTTGANSGKPNIATSPSNTQDVQIGANAYTLTGAVADVVNISSVASIGGISGTLTFSTNVSVLDGALGNAVISGFAPTIVRPNDRLTTNDIISSDILNLSTCRRAVTQLQNNAVDGPYTFVMNYTSWQQLYADPEFQLLFRGTQFNSPEYSMLKPTAPIFDFNILLTNQTFSQNLNSLSIQRPILVGNGALIEADYVGAQAVLERQYGTEIHDIREVDGVYHVMRSPIDRLAQIIAQSWFFISGYTVPTDQTTNPNFVPTSNSAYYKRAVIVETA